MSIFTGSITTQKRYQRIDVSRATANTTSVLAERHGEFHLLPDQVEVVEDSW